MVGGEGVVIVAVAVDIVGIDFVYILWESESEVPAASWLVVEETGASIVGDKVWVDEVVVDHVLDAIFFESSSNEGHDPVSHQ